MKKQILQLIRIVLIKMITRHVTAISLPENLAYALEYYLKEQQQTNPKFSRSKLLQQAVKEYLNNREVKTD